MNQNRQPRRLRGVTNSAGGQSVCHQPVHPAGNLYFRELLAPLQTSRQQAGNPNQLPNEALRLWRL